jgi:hypothetical protein
MNHILVGSSRYIPTHHIIDIIDDEIRNADHKKNVKVYFLDHRVSTRIAMADYILESDISHNISECSIRIVSELITNLESEVCSYSQIQLIIFFNLDSIDSTDPNVIKSILHKLLALSSKIDISIICHTTSRFLNNIPLELFDRIHMFKDTATDSLDILCKYLVDTKIYYHDTRLRKLIAQLDPDSANSIYYDILHTMSDYDISKYGRIIAHYRYNEYKESDSSYNTIEGV